MSLCKTMDGAQRAVFAGGALGPIEHNDLVGWAAIQSPVKQVNDPLAEMFLSEAEAEGLKFDEKPRVTIPEAEFILTYADLIELILALQPPSSATATDAVRPQAV